MLANYSKTCKHICKESRIFESSNQDFLMFVIKYLSDDPDNWKNEWDYEGMYKAKAQCVCGKEGLTKVFVVRNTVTNNVLSPIGSVCIGHFSKNVLNSIKSTLNENLLSVILSDNKYNESKLAMSTKYLSKEEVSLLNRACIITDEETDICLKALNKKGADIETFLDATDIFIDKIIPALKKSLITALSNTRADANDVYFDRDTRNYFETLYRFTKQNRFNVSDIEDFFGENLPGSNVSSNRTQENVSESLIKTKKRIYSEIKYLDSYHKNYYESRIVEKGTTRYLVLENHLMKCDTLGGFDYSTLPTEINAFVVEPDVETVDELLDDEDFENDFRDLPEPNFSITILSDDDVKRFFDSL